MSPNKWKLISKQDISPSKWFPLEKREYQLPNGQTVNDFYITTLADVSAVVPITVDKKVVLTNQFKPGVDEVILQFPAGRFEPQHPNALETAIAELEEEVGIKANPKQLTKFARLTGFSTKATEIVHIFLAKDCRFNSQQNLDVTEDIEVITVSPEEMDRLVESNKIWCAQTVAGWELAKKKFGSYLGY